MELVVGSEPGTVYVPSTAKARALGLRIKVPLREALEKTVAAVRIGKEVYGNPGRI
jgi:hypothetical protein